jgi:hypothetical protein
VIIRDTSFTASHIIAFYFTFPLYITMGVASYLYAMTRLPQFSKAVSFPLVGAIVGPMMILPNVGLNEWGHAFWFVDELFAAPLHWGFVTLGWCGLFGGTGGADCGAHVQPVRCGLEQREQGLLARDPVLNPYRRRASRHPWATFYLMGGRPCCFVRERAEYGGALLPGHSTPRSL